MKLTLRTLLAYLDDVLEPNEAREIGQKISQSKEAADLVNQIRESMRRRRIGTPELAGPGSGPDPNIVSEYLENVLLPNQVVEYEQLCRRSDMHLAEVAACHKILTMVMGQPIDVSDELRERMYALGAPKEVQPFAETSKAIPVMANGMASPQSPVPSDGLPEYLTQGRKSGRLWTVLTILIVAGVWIGLVVSDKSIWTPRPEAIADLETSADAAPSIEEDKATDSDVEPEKMAAKNPPSVKPQRTAKADQETTSNQTDSPRKNVSVNPPPPAEDAVAASSLPKPQIDNKMPAAPGEMQAPVNQPETPAEPPAPGLEIAKADPPAVEKPSNVTPWTILPPEEINIIQKKASSQWVTIRNGAVNIGDHFAVPEPFQGALDFQGDLSLRLLGGTKVERLSDVEGVDLRFRVERGRCLLKRKETSIKARTVELVIGKDSWRFDFPEPGAELGIEVLLPQPDGRIVNGPPLPVHGSLGTVRGKLLIQEQGQDKTELLSSHGWLVWSEDRARLNWDQPQGLPAWTRPDELLLTPARQQLIKAYEREFETDVLLSIAPVVSDRRAMISEFATKTLALTGNDLEIVPALESDHEEARLAAIIALRERLARDPESIAQIRSEMERLYRSDLVEIMVNLLWGYSRQEGESPEISQMLVELLANENLSIRQMAHFQVLRLSGRNYGYHPQAPLSERNAAVSRWVEFVKRDKSLVQPK